LQRIEASDVYYFPLWEKGVHDILQKHFQELSLIFLAYCRSLLGSDSAEDAVEMEVGAAAFEPTPSAMPLVMKRSQPQTEISCRFRWPNFTISVRSVASRPKRYHSVRKSPMVAALSA
jgi:hypothetical protein